MNSLHNEFDQGRIDFGVNLKRVKVCTPEVTAFYRILLGHQYRVAVIKAQIFAGKHMMIGKGMRHTGKAGRSDLGKKTRGVADARNRVHTQAGQGGGGKFALR